MASMPEMTVRTTVGLDPETKVVIEGLTDQIKALRDLLETKAGPEVHYHFDVTGLDQQQLDRLMRSQRAWRG